MEKKSFFVWIDCEMTGLNELYDHILECAVIITDLKLNIIYEKEWIIHHSDSVLDNMNEWSAINHNQSGLVDRVKLSNIQYADIEKELIEQLEKIGEKRTFYIAGNSVYNDVQFIKKHMPDLISWFHYRLYDISSLKLLYTLVLKKESFKKVKKHRAIDDIRETINEYVFYLNNMIHSID